jgi:hypothetical protein
MTKSNEILKTIEKRGLAAKGKNEMLRHLYGERLTIRQMAVAKCYDCMGYYSDGRGTDCEIPECPLYPIMPYKSGEKYAIRKMSEEHREKLRAGMRDRLARK